MSIAFLAIFFVRRILIVALFHVDILSLRYGLIMGIVQIPYLCYLIVYKPLIEELSIEIVNEAVLCFTYLFVHLYSDATPSAQDRYDFGWLAVVFFLALFVINIVHITIPVMKGLK